MIREISEDDIAELESLINYQFNNIDLLLEALSHPSLKQYNSSVWQKNYERFEILGDALLGFIITEIVHSPGTCQT